MSVNNICIFGEIRKQVYILDEYSMLSRAMSDLQVIAEKSAAQITEGTLLSI